MSERIVNRLKDHTERLRASGGFLAKYRLMPSAMASVMRRSQELTRWIARASAALMLRSRMHLERRARAARTNEAEEGADPPAVPFPAR